MTMKLELQVKIVIIIHVPSLLSAIFLKAAFVPVGELACTALKTQTCLVSLGPGEFQSIEARETSVQAVKELVGTSGWFEEFLKLPAKNMKLNDHDCYQWFTQHFTITNYLAYLRISCWVSCLGKKFVVI